MQNTKRQAKNEKIQIPKFDTYISMIKKSTGTRMFQNLHAIKNGKKFDITKNGELSCATYATAILKIFDLITSRHATVIGTIKDMKKNGWYEIKKPRLGAIITWGPWKKAKTNHIGFYIGKDTVISNYEPKKTPAKHHWTFGITDNGKPKRSVESIWWHKNLKR